MSNIKADFSVGMTTLTAHGLHQWDYGQTLAISHPFLPAMIEVHFAAAGAEEAIVRVASSAAGVATVAIPDSLLEQTRPIHAWVYVKSETAGETTLTVVMPLVKRARPTAAGPVPEELGDIYTEAVSAMNEAVESVRAGDVIVARALIANNAAYANQADNATNAVNANVAVYANEAGIAREARSAEQDSLGNYIDETYVSFGNAFTLYTKYNGAAANSLPAGSYQFKVRISDTDYYALLEVPSSGTSAAVIYVDLGLTASSALGVDILVVSNGTLSVKSYTRAASGSGANNITDVTGNVAIYYRKIH